jgi:hypothetical protein
MCRWALHFLTISACLDRPSGLRVRRQMYSPSGSLASETLDPVGSACKVGDLTTLPSDPGELGYLTLNIMVLCLGIERFDSSVFETKPP